MVNGKKVSLHITGKSKTPEGTDSTELYTQGELFQKEGDTYLFYDDTEATGFAGCRTMLHFQPRSRRVTMRRTGRQQAFLVIAQGGRNTGFYGTPYGDLTIGINGIGFAAAFDEHGGSGSFSYQMDANTRLISTHEVTVTAKESEQS